MTLTSELSLEAVLQKVVDVAHEQIGARYAALSVLGADGRIEQFITSGITPQERERIGPIPAGRGLLGVLLHEGSTLNIEDISKDPRSIGFPPNHPEMKSLLGVPVIWHDQILGNLYLTEKIGGERFDERDEQLVRFLSTQAAVAITNARLYEGEQTRAHEWQALFEVSRDVTASHDLQELLDFVVRRASELLSTEVAVLNLVNPDGESLKAVAGIGTRNQGSDRRLIASSTLLRRTLEHSQPVIIEDYHEEQAASGDGRWSLMEDEQLISAVLVPVLGEGGGLGVLMVGNHTFTQFSDREALLLQTFANMVAVALERRTLTEKLESLARLEERERIGMDLHDGIIQSIYAVALHLEDCADRLEEEPEEVKPSIEHAIDDLNKVIKDIRSYIFDLRPQLSHVQDVPQALHQLVEHFRVNSLITTTLDIDNTFAAIGGESEAMALFHIAQEALNNAAKHSKATNVSIRLHPTAGGIMLEVTDNGIGFTPPADGVSGAHHGLRNMRDRARSVGGVLAYDSTPGEGTTVRITLHPRQKGTSDG
ncbi:MAG TPA: GAF domain-containing protein [Dehalococcoidia bacterium]|nr:GAF domain-containing protein [Dehalococcoidia bacterium]